MEENTLLNTIEYLWGIIDDIDTYGDMAKSDNKLFRSLVERRQKDRWKTGITTNGYCLNFANLKTVDPIRKQEEGFSEVMSFNSREVD